MKINESHQHRIAIRKLVKSIRSTALCACLDEGISDYRDIRKVLSDARLLVKPMTIAGIKAAVTKGQIPRIINPENARCGCRTPMGK